MKLKDRIHRVDQLEMEIPIRIQQQTDMQLCRTRRMDHLIHRAHRVNIRRRNLP